MPEQAFCVVLDSQSRLLCWVLPPRASVYETADSAEASPWGSGSPGDERGRQRGFSQGDSSRLQGKRDAAGELPSARAPGNVSAGASFPALVFLASPVQCRDAALRASCCSSSTRLPGELARAGCTAFPGTQSESVQGW